MVPNCSCYVAEHHRIVRGTVFSQVMQHLDMSYYRFEIYCGKKKRGDGSIPPLYNNVSGTAAVYRNLKAVFPWQFETEGEFQSSTNKRVIVCDREYTSLTLVKTLKEFGFYTLGTCVAACRIFLNVH